MLDDFPSDPQSQRKGEIFIHWVRLCAIVGRIAKSLSRSHGVSTPNALESHRRELVNWVSSLPPHLQLPISSARTHAFDRDVHQLHLPYLTTIIILYMKRSASPRSVPEALPPAIVAASCIVRILRDILSRGNVRFLMAITCWYTGTAFLALQQARSVEHLARDADEGIDVLARTAEQLQNMWASANVIRGGIERLRNASNVRAPAQRAPSHGGSVHEQQAHQQQRHEPGFPSADGSAMAEETAEEDFGDFDWTALFPFVTRDTSSIANSLLKNKAEGHETRGFPSPTNFMSHESLMIQYDHLFDTTTDLWMDFVVAAPDDGTGVRGGALGT